MRIRTFIQDQTSPEGANSHQNGLTSSDFHVTSFLELCRRRSTLSLTCSVESSRLTAGSSMELLPIICSDLRFTTGTPFTDPVLSARRAMRYVPCHSFLHLL